MPDTSGREKSAASGPPVGRVVGTEDSTPLQFSVALDQDAYLQLDDVVVTVRPVPGREPVATAGVVTEVRARHEGATYGSDVFLIADGVLPAQVQEIAEVTTTRVDPEVYVPPWPGAFAYRATGEERAKALYFDQMEHKVAVGLGRDGDPIYLNLEFLDGTRGGHVSISGISGVATKTSFALFLLYSIFTGGVLEERAEREGAGVQRQGRGSAVPRPHQPPAGRRPAGRLRDARSRRPRRSPRSGSSPRRRPTTSPAARTSSAAPAG